MSDQIIDLPARAALATDLLEVQADGGGVGSSAQVTVGSVVALAGPPGPSGGAVQSETKTLLTSNILNLLVAGFELVPTPGGSKYIWPIVVILQSAGTVFVTGGSNLFPQWGTATDGSAAYMNPTGFDAGDILGPGISSCSANINNDAGYPVGNLADKPFCIGLESPGPAFTDPGGADSTVTVTVLYSILDAV